MGFRSQCSLSYDHYVLASSIFLSIQDQSNYWISGQVNILAETEIPVFMRSYIYKWYANYFDANLEEVELPLNDYPTFSTFFTRKIIRKAADYAQNTISSPCDGKLLSLEEVTEDKCNIIKGHKYSLSEVFLGESSEVTDQPIHTYIRKNNKNKLYQMIIYLAPGDYHRFHSPADMTIKKEKEIEG